MNCHHSMLRLLVIVNSLLTFGQCADVSEKTFQFEIEHVEYVGQSLYPDSIEKAGPVLPEEESFVTKLCTATLNYISSKFQQPLNDTRIGPSSPCWGWLKYSDKADEEFIHYKYCGEIRRRIYVRAAHNPANTFIIMIDGFARIGWNEDLFYGMSPKEYLFNIRLIDGNPVRIAADGQLEEDTLLSTIENDGLRNIYKPMNLLDWILVCLKAKHHIMEHGSMDPPITHHSRVGYRLLTLSKHGNNEMEERVGYQCPMRPVTYVYLEDSRTAGVVLVIAP